MMFERGHPERKRFYDAKVALYLPFHGIRVWTRGWCCAVLEGALGSRSLKYRPFSGHSVDNFLMLYPVKSTEIVRDLTLLEQNRTKKV